MSDAYDPAELERLAGHVVICHANDKVRGIVEELHAPAEPRPLDVVLLDPDPELWRRHPRWRPVISDQRARFITVVGDPSDPGDLTRAGMRRAQVAVILADPRLGDLADARSTLVAMAIERQNPHVHTIIELIASVNRVHLRATEINEVVCRGEVAERLIAQSCISPGVKNLFAELLAAAADTNQIFLLPLPPAADGSTFRQLARHLIRARAPLTACGFVRVTAAGGGRPLRQVVLNPPARAELGKDTALRGGQDELIVVARWRPDLATWLVDD